MGSTIIFPGPSQPFGTQRQQLPCLQCTEAHSRCADLLSNSCFSELITAQMEVQGGWAVVHTATHPSHAVAAANGRSQL